MKKLIEMILMIAASIAIGLIPWGSMPWLTRIGAGVGVVAFFVWIWVDVWRESKVRLKGDPITVHVFISYPMLVAIVFGVFSIVWILIR